jgi:hypothetical protein
MFGVTKAFMEMSKQINLQYWHVKIRLKLSKMFFFQLFYYFHDNKRNRKTLYTFSKLTFLQIQKLRKKNENIQVEFSLKSGTSTPLFNNIKIIIAIQLPYCHYFKVALDFLYHYIRINS